MKVNENEEEAEIAADEAVKDMITDGGDIWAVICNKHLL